MVSELPAYIDGANYGPEGEAAANPVFRAGTEQPWVTFNQTENVFDIVAQGQTREKQRTSFTQSIKSCEM